MKGLIVYSLVKITRLYDYTWQTYFWRNSQGAQRLVGFFLDCAFNSDAHWLGRRTLITWCVCTQNVFLDQGSIQQRNYKCTLQIGPLPLRVHTNLNSIKVFASSHYKPPTCIYNGILWNSSGNFTSALCNSSYYRVEPAVQRFSCESEAFGYRFEEKVFMYQVF